MVVIPVRWNKPPSSWFKLNTNEASMGNLGKVGGGGLIRDCSDNWVKGFLDLLDLQLTSQQSFGPSGTG